MECIRNWIMSLIDQTNVTDICINGVSGVFVDRGSGMEQVSIPVDLSFTEQNLKEWVLSELVQVGKTWDAKHPFVDAILRTGHRIHIVFPPLAPLGLMVSIRRSHHHSHDSNLAQPSPTQADRWSQSDLYPKLQELIKSGESILISGATGSGKTTLASDLLAEVPQNERIIALEDTPELAPRHPHFISLLSRPPNADGFGEVTLKTLLKQTLRMRPDRIVLGECRGAEVLDLLQALNTGHRGALVTLHANSPRDALRRVELLCLLSAHGVLNSSYIRELLSLGIQWITQVKREGCLRMITELWKMEGREGDTILMRRMNRQ